MVDEGKEAINAVIESDEDYLRYLETRLKQLEEERRKLLVKIEYYRSEIEKLLSPPLIEAIVEYVLPDNRVIVKSQNGPKPRCTGRGTTLINPS
jgi:proteasome regulatory subunit